MKTEFVVAIITSSGAVLSALVIAIAGLIAAKRVISRKKLRTDLITAMKDIQFLLELEKAHNEINITVQGKCNKNIVREAVRKEKSLDLSGKNSLSSIKRKLALLSNYDD
tara:strand:+ start:1056 stop:1385 length:330 start_codon:yes stop_codon:yes gene_type:complete